MPKPTATRPSATTIQPALCRIDLPAPPVANAAVKLPSPRPVRVRNAAYVVISTGTTSSPPSSTAGSPSSSGPYERRWRPATGRPVISRPTTSSSRPFAENPISPPFRVRAQPSGQPAHRPAGLLGGRRDVVEPTVSHPDQQVLEHLPHPLSAAERAQLVGQIELDHLADGAQLAGEPPQLRGVARAGGVLVGGQEAAEPFYP